MAVAILFCLGVINFAAHKAVIESDHPLLAQLPWLFEPLGGRLSLAVEFLVLTGAMVLAHQGSAGWVWGYAAYSVMNGISAWAILTGRL
jgi:hypothetical protein